MTFLKDWYGLLVSRESIASTTYLGRVAIWVRFEQVAQDSQPDVLKMRIRAFMPIALALGKSNIQKQHWATPSSALKTLEFVCV